ncbi:MAG: hypothetical protein QOH58_654 [Thermoleophilaceae bacterium]|jgi:hypothetical protein|nr:hypothetical protein [Thermoleophilaceae bacterium]
MRTYRKITIVACLLAALTVGTESAAAAPKAGVWKADEIQLGKNLKFTVKKGKITNISANVLESCTGSSYSTWTTFAPDSSWKIKNGRFSGRQKESFGDLTAYVTFKGRFTGRSTAKGILRQETIVAGSVCDTRELSWRAKAR